MPLNAAKGSGDLKGPEAKPPVVGLGDEVPQKLKLFAHLHLIIIWKNGYRKCVFRCVDIVHNVAIYRVCRYTSQTA